MIYLDNAATTKPSEAATNAFLQATEEFGNPSSLHGIGLRMEKLISSARKTLADKMSVDSKNIYFTSGGTEANNLAVLGTADALKRRGRRVITSKIEHPSVLEAFRYLEKNGFDVKYIDVNPDGRVNIDCLQSNITEDTTLVSIMHVNNETGVIQPIKEISKIVRETAPNCKIHSDCVQSFGKLPVNPDSMGVDMVSISAHKIHGFKGTGVLYTKNKHISPILHGGEQQGEVRPGTENTGGILAFAAAAEECKQNYADMQNKRAIMRDLLLAKSDKVKVNGSCEFNSGSVLNVSFPGIKAEILLHSLERHEIFVSTGSACSSHKPQPSHVLQAMGVAPADIAGAVRISFCESTSEEDIVYAAEKIADEAAAIMRYM